MSTVQGADPTSQHIESVASDAAPPTSENRLATVDGDSPKSSGALLSNKNWDRVEYATMAATTAALSAGALAPSTPARALGFGLLSVKSWEKTARYAPDPRAVLLNGTQATGIGVWAGGVAAGSSTLQGVGPAVVAAAGAAQLAHSAMEYKNRGAAPKSDINLAGEFFEIAEMTLLSAGAFTHNSSVRAAGFAAWSAGHLHAALRKRDPLHVGEAVGAGLWAGGVASDSSILQGVGPAIIGAAQVARLAHTYWTKEDRSQPILPLHHMGRPGEAGGRLPESPVHQRDIAAAAAQGLTHAVAARTEGIPPSPPPASRSSLPTSSRSASPGR